MHALFRKGRFLFLFVPLLIRAQSKSEVLRVDELRCNTLANPLAIDDPHPRLSWKLYAKGGGLVQTAYEIKVYEGGSTSVVWETGVVASDNSIGVAYTGKRLQSDHLYHYRVRVWDNKRHVSGWSRLASFGTGFLSSEDWKAEWITPGFFEDTVQRPPPIFRRHYFVKQLLRSARLFITAHGIYEASINGTRVGKDYFMPGWTSYHKRLQYQVYDVTDNLRKGSNNIQVTVADGWWRGVFGGDMTSNHYGTTAGLLFQLEIIYADGSKERMVSDSSWRCSQGAIRYADFYNGEIYDARWRKYDDTNEMAVRIANDRKDNLVATETPGVRSHERFKPLKIINDPEGGQIVDFGQNIAGWVRLRVKARKGDTIRVQHAETLDKDGNFYTGNLRKARAEDLYILSGLGYDTLEPHFTYHGFRYARISGVKDLFPKDLEAISVYTDLPSTGTFECSNPLLNQLQHNILWSQRDNFIDIPTDCPQRSERYGWTGDAQIFARTASFNQNIQNFFSKWLKDLKADQDSLGGLPVIIPDLYNHDSKAPKRSVAGWGDAATIIPWALFRAYGDTSRLREQYPAMKAWVNNIQGQSPEDLWFGTGYGDWLAPDTVTLTPLPFICQCYYANSCDLLVKAATVLKMQDDSVYYIRLLQRVKSVFLRVYWPLPATETAYALALDFDMLPDSLRGIAVSQFVTCVHDHNDHLSTGFLGTPALLPALSDNKQTDLAYAILLQEAVQSWLYPIKKGATTIWEKWDAITPDGKVGEKSLNHYSYGAVGDWLYRFVAGIRELKPGYKRFEIRPNPGGGLTWSKASFYSPYGKIVSNWKIEHNKFLLHIEIPVNTEASVWLPGRAHPVVVGSGIYEYTN